MTKFGWLVMVGAVVLLIAGSGLALWLHSSKIQHSATSSQASTTPMVDPSTLSIYTSGEYGFSFFYPSKATVTDSFSVPALSGSWRSNPIASGTPIVEVSDASAQLMVGVSSDAREVAVCTKAGPAEQAQGPLTVGSTTWQLFTFDRLGTEDERHVQSYRALFEKKCFAVEVRTPLTTTATSTGYSVADTITSFSFAL